MVEIEVCWQTEGDVLGIRFAGAFRGEDLTRAIEKIRALTAKTSFNYTVFFATGVTDYDADVRGPARELLTLLKEHGCRTGVVSTERGAVRMIAGAVSLAAGFRMKVASTDAEALEVIEELRTLDQRRAARANAA